MTDTKFKTSFIPKKPMQTVGSGGRIKKNSIYGVFTLLSIIIFILAIAGTVGVHLYTIKLNNDISAQETEIANTVESLDKSLISEAVRLNDRIVGVEKLLNEHLSPSQIFVILEEKTVKTISFNDLSLNFDNDGDLLLRGSGSAAGFESIIQQSDEYGRNGYMRDLIFSNLQNKERGFVSFVFESSVDPEIILYTKALPDINESNILDDSEGVSQEDQSDPENTSEDESSSLIDNMQ